MQTSRVSRTHGLRKAARRGWRFPSRREVPMQVNRVSRMHGFPISDRHANSRNARRRRTSARLARSSPVFDRRVWNLRDLRKRWSEDPGSRSQEARGAPARRRRTLRPRLPEPRSNGQTEAPHGPSSGGPKAAGRISRRRAAAIARRAAEATGAEAGGETKSPGRPAVGGFGEVRRPAPLRRTRLRSLSR